jgi:hypothetical protein
MMEEDDSRQGIEERREVVDERTLLDEHGTDSGYGPA